MSDTNKQRKDGKRSNNKKDQELVSIVKALFKKGVPANIIAPLYNIAPSTVFMLGLDHRQANVQPATEYQAVTDINSRFSKLLGS